MGNENDKVLSKEILSVLNQIRRSEKLTAKNEYVGYDLRNNQLEVLKQREIINHLESEGLISIESYSISKGIIIPSTIEEHNFFYNLKIDSEKIEAMINDLSKKIRPLIFNEETGDVFMDNKEIGNIKPLSPEYELFKTIYDSYLKGYNFATHEEIFNKYLQVSKKVESRYSLSPQGHSYKYKGVLPPKIKDLIQATNNNKGQKGYRINLLK